MRVNSLSTSDLQYHQYFFLCKKEGSIESSLTVKIKSSHGSKELLEFEWTKKINISILMIT